MRVVRERKKKKWKIILAVPIVLLLILLIAYTYVINVYRIKNVYVEGNYHYTQEEIKEMVMSGKYGDNSLFLAMKYKDKGMTNVPFVDTMDVDILAPDTIQITVYEKALAGCISHLGVYVYFDKDGIVVETSSQSTAGVPVVEGMTFHEVILNEPLPVDDTEIFKTVLNITKLTEKYGVSADAIRFDNSRNMTLCFGNIRVALGQAVNLDEKIMNLKNFLPSLDGMSGVVHMESYSDTSQNITFEKDN